MHGQFAVASTIADVPEDDDDLDAAEQEALEESLVDDATAARTTAELESEIVILKGLENQAKLVVASGKDRKWDELSQLLQHNPAMYVAPARLPAAQAYPIHRTP